MGFVIRWNRTEEATDVESFPSKF